MLMSVFPSINYQFYGGIPYNRFCNYQLLVEKEDLQSRRKVDHQNIPLCSASHYQRAYLR